MALKSDRRDEMPRVSTETSDLERKIDELVYDLYGLSEGERKIILSEGPKYSFGGFLAV